MEKPISHSLERVDQLAAELQRSGAKLAVGFQFRFHPGLAQVKAWLAQGKIGRAYSFRAHWGEYLPNWHPWEDYRQGYAARPDLGGGVVLTLTHPLDYLRWLFGEAESLWAYAGTLGELGIAVTDSAEIGLKFQNGPAGTVHLDYLQRLPAHTLEIGGTQGLIRWDNASGNASLFQAETGAWEEYRVPEGFDRNWLFLDELRNFIAAARGQAEPLCTLDDGAWALRLALAAHQSAGSGQKVQF
jgi:predicted dehydrogenase